MAKATETEVEKERMKKKKAEGYAKGSAADRLRKGVAGRMQAAEDVYTGRKQRKEQQRKDEQKNK